MPARSSFRQPPPFGGGMQLAGEEHEQCCDHLQQLLVAQLQVDCQFQHCFHSVYAGSAANLVRLALVGTKRPAELLPAGFLCHLTAGACMHAGDCCGRR